MVLYKRMAKLWSDEETKYLVENWSTKTPEELSKKLNRGLSALKKKARTLGLFRSKKKQATYFPEISEKAKTHLEELLPLLMKNTNRLDKWLDQLESRIANMNNMSAKDILALAKAVESFNRSVAEMKELSGLLEKNLKVENLTVNMNVYGLMQIANEIMDETQRTRYIEAAKSRGIVYEATP